MSDLHYEDLDALLDSRRTYLSEERTQLALQRTLWAAEQTLNAWLRTALAAVAAGLAVFQFITSSIAWVAPAIASILMLTGVALYVFALWRYATETKRLEAAGVLVTPTWLVALIVTPLLAVGILALLLLVG